MDSNNVTDAEKLKDVIINLTNKKYPSKDVISALAWGEKNTKVYYTLMKKYQPKYYTESVGTTPINSFTLLKDLKNLYEGDFS